MKRTESYAVVTGASMGLGKEIALELARRGHNLILVALPGEGLEELSSIICQHYGVVAACYECDLTERCQTLELIDWIKANQFEIFMLINNAGIGCTQFFTDMSLHFIDQVIMLNVRAMVMLTHELLPILKQQKQSYVLNIASLASFSPMPYKSIYPASKAFVYSFSRGLHAEYKYSNVFVSVAHPGGMATNQCVSQRIQQYNRWVRACMLTAEQTAGICVRQLLRRDSLIIPGLINKFAWLAMKLVPVWMRLNIFRNTILKEVNHV